MSASASARRGFALHNPFLSGSASLAAAASASAQGHAAAGSGAGAAVSSVDPSHSGSSSGVSSVGSLDASLRWIRFHAPDSQRMLSFYMGVLKMQMDRQIDAGAKFRTCFQYPGDKVGLRFEYDRYGKNQPRTREGGALPTAPTTTVSLLIYVDSVGNFASRCREAGFVVWVEPTTLSTEPLVRSAVLLDPSGLKVRLLEGEVVYALNRVRYRARLGYVSLPMREWSSVERSMAFFAGVFGAGRGRAESHIMAAANANTGSSSGGGGGGIIGSSSAGAGGSGSKLSPSCFRLVDMERFVEELTTHVWLGNGSRKKHTCVCLFHQIKRKFPVPDADDEDDFDDDDGESTRENMRAQMTLIDRKLEASEPEEAKLFLGLSFTVADIEHAVNFLRTTEVGAPTSGGSGGSGGGGAGNSAPNRLEVQHIPGFPRFISFVDPSQIPLEISDGAMTMGGAGSMGSAALTTIQSGPGAVGGAGVGVGVGGSATAAAMLMRSNMMRASAAATAAATFSPRHAPRPVPSPPTRPMPSPGSGTGRRPTAAAYSPSPDSSRSSSPARDEWSDEEAGGRGAATVASSGGRAGRRVLHMSHDDSASAPLRHAHSDDDDGLSDDE